MAYASRLTFLESTLDTAQHSKLQVAIIGGGSVGVAYFVQLVEETVRLGLGGRLDILIFEAQATTGPGFAYSADAECNLLNTRADAMSVLAHDKRHFVDWIAEHGARHAADYPDTVIADHAFLPRSLFGRYLMHQFDAACTLARQHGIAVTRIESEVTDLIALHSRRPCIDTADAGAFVVDRAVLCVGNQPSTVLAHLQGRHGFYNSPYPTRDLAHAIPPLAPVCIIGTGLSAIDTVLSLSAAGHRGKIILASRNGRLPSVRGTVNQSHTLELLTRESVDAMCAANGGALPLEAVFATLQQEIQRASGLACDLAAIMNAGAGILDYIASEIAMADNAERLWQSVIYATNGVIDYVWHRLAHADKLRFQSLFGSLWSSYRVSFPLKNAQRLHALLRADRVLVFGGVKSVSFNEASKTFETRIDQSDSGLRSVIESDYLINATGYCVDVARSQVPLVCNLLRRKLASANEFGGFNLDFDTGCLVDAAGALAPNVTVLGSLAAGTYFWTNAMDVNVRLAKRQVSDLLRSLSTAEMHPLRPISIGAASASLPDMLPAAAAQHSQRMSA
jgi:uncharacterized NAD(P)/FAD-binding protein YdhS